MVARSQDELLHIVRNGGSLDLQAKGHSQQDLVQLVSNLTDNASIALRGVGAISTADLVHISSNNKKGKVVFVID